MIEMVREGSGRIVVRANRAKAYVFGLLLPALYISLLTLGVYTSFRDGGLDRLAQAVLLTVVDVAAVAEAVFRIRRKNVVVVDLQAQEVYTRNFLPLLLLLRPRKYPLSELKELRYEFCIWWYRRWLVFVFEDGYRLPIIQSEYGYGSSPSEVVTKLHEHIAEAVGIPYNVSQAGQL